MKKRCQKGRRKSWFLGQNGDLGLTGSTYPLTFDVLVRCQQITIEVTRWATKTNKYVQNKPGNIISVDEGVLMVARFPGAATRATRKQRKERRKQKQLESLKGKVEILESLK